MQGRLRRIAIVSVVVPVALVVAVIVAWAATGGADAGRAARNLSLAGISIGSAHEPEVAAAAERAAARLEDGRIMVRSTGGDFVLTAGDAGLHVDRDATVSEALEAGGHHELPMGPFRWAASFIDEQSADVVVTLDTERLAAAVAEVDPSRTAPVEPALDVDDSGGIAVIPPQDGQGIDPSTLAAAVIEAATSGDEPIEVEVDPTTLPSRFSEAEARTLASEAQRLTDDGLQVDVADQTAVVPPEQLRAWFRLDSTGADLALAVDVDRVNADLAELLPDAGEPARDAGFEIVEGAVRITPDQTGFGCCAPEGADRILAALTAGDGTVELPLTTTFPDRTVEDAARLGVVEEVATFTTKHACCQGRVKNIQRIADLVRGAVIEPGEQFSLNGFVGRRTRAKGFVDAGVIYNGVFESDVGGGISQFVTTFFNAAFFAGLEFEEYQSHSIYISRYPYGREATISFPKPDFVISNPTPHAVLVWPTYDSTSITVSLWSTKSVEVTQTGQSKRPQGRCTRVTTSRQRTWLDTGEVSDDSVFAVYRPGEGVNC